MDKYWVIRYDYFTDGVEFGYYGGDDKTWDDKTVIKMSDATIFYNPVIPHRMSRKKKYLHLVEHTANTLAKELLNG